MDHRPLGIGVIGAGHILQRHALAYKSLPQLARLVAIADLDSGRAEAARQRYGFSEALLSHSELLARGDIDAVSICTPAAAHSRMVCEALRAGKHVLCEKPLATTLANADEIIRESEKHPNQTVSCVFQLRHDPSNQRMRWMIREGHIGRVLLARLCVRMSKSPAYYTSAPGRGSWSTDGGGVVINQAIHLLDAAVSCLGDPQEVSATMDARLHPIEAEDTLTGWIRFESGVLATIECTTCAKNKEFSLDVVGENAGMRLSGDPDAQKFDWKVYARGSAANKATRSLGLKAFPEPPNPKGLAAKVQKLRAKLSRRDVLPPLHWGHTPLVQAFLEAARRREPGPVPPAEARRSLALATALYESAHTRRAVGWPLDDGNELYHGMTRSAPSEAAAALAS